MPADSEISENIVILLNIEEEQKQHRSTQRVNLDGEEETESYLSEVQRDVHLVVLSAAGQRRALPPSLCPVDGVGDGMGAVTVPLAADVTVLALKRQKHRCTFNLYSSIRV